ncbi:Uncharacterized protein Fot_03775 [Forsythia ovata]|uniref:Uncharacterized protein n=1 Tax=Forsythia ovata TaxID=205694 RepID=A0ABD1XAN0_9LAMI
MLLHYILVHFDMIPNYSMLSNHSFVSCLLCGRARDLKIVVCTVDIYAEMIFVWERPLTGSSFSGLFSVYIDIYQCYQETIPWFRCLKWRRNTCLGIFGCSFGVKIFQVQPSCFHQLQ